MPLHRTLGMLAKYVKLANLNAFVSSDWDRAIFKVGETAKRRRKGTLYAVQMHINRSLALTYVRSCQIHL